MITLQQLGEQLQKWQTQNKQFAFYADHYTVHIKFNDKDKIYICVALENLTKYNKVDKIARLTHYVRLNISVLGCAYSTLAYNKDNDVIVQQWLEKHMTTQQILHAIDYLLKHADMLTDTCY